MVSCGQFRSAKSSSEAVLPDIDWIKSVCKGTNFLQFDKNFRKKYENFLWQMLGGIRILPVGAGSGLA